MTPDRTDIKTGIVGLGNIGQYHAERLVDLGVPLVGGMDVAAEARTRFARRYDVDVYDDHRALYDGVDAVIITTPNKYHEEYAVDAFERGLHVLLEKPLAHSIDSAKRIAEAAAASDGVGMVGFNNRFANTVRIVKNRIERGDLGDVSHIEANYVRRRGIPGRGSWFTRRQIAGGGALIDLGVHAIDLALYLLEYPAVEEVTGVSRGVFGSREEYAYLDMWAEDAGPGGFDVDDSASAFIRCGDNRTISLEVAWATNRPATHEFVARGTDAAARFDLLEGDLSVHSASNVGPDHLEDTTIETRQNDTHSDEQRAFFGRIVGDGDAVGTCADSVQEALTVQRLVDGIYRSSEEGRTVRIDE
ncbi:Gfo/Idh/MocA family oxidoreductase [Natrinema thermotolerans]|uniref:Gfo/Idh/MocA family oxidoreductase n=1 Tax=Natrinema thermotolerans TaxID=121872 RepID=A0AAF0PC02_9EURY|nr:Gfo/Idh/MocA family oxidoreductase [Natrinema thermotolerans]QCC60690.1 gfo/Idh/MocA family oxidoreductase [Natrinema thermotolerans]WMT07733.1 Gfo/Idh/MocA family oxidoreductase [Natrinema thermotolerans]WMT08365.1 Gfo/Idh/MocA family oxidoreductase [Natrinema thermotolerans]